jgi:ribosomal protein RSM22 (predicted rRNA methylase)
MVFHSQLEEVLQGLQEDLLRKYKQTSLTKAFERISERYRNETGFFLQTEEERWAYLFTRLPGTFAVALKVFEEIKSRCPDLAPKSLLDVGAGPGTGMWAAAEVFGTYLEECTLIEQDSEFLSIGKQLALHSSFPAVQNASWNLSDMTGSLNVKPHDITILSYSIGEVEGSCWKDLLSNLWNATQKAIVIVEPGTPRGYKRMMKIRDHLLELGGFIWAPCPHHLTCPIQEGDWCHFYARVQRSSFHRKLKSADLGYEDEKFSYLVVGKEPCATYRSRIIRHPMKRTGHVEMTLCQNEGIKKEIFSKRDKEKYRGIKKLNWGDVIN